MTGKALLEQGNSRDRCRPAARCIGSSDEDSQSREASSAEVEWSRYISQRLQVSSSSGPEGVDGVSRPFESIKILSFQGKREVDLQNHGCGGLCCLGTTRRASGFTCRFRRLPIHRCHGEIGMHHNDQDSRLLKIRRCLFWGVDQGHCTSRQHVGLELAGCMLRGNCCGGLIL